MGWIAMTPSLQMRKTQENKGLFWTPGQDGLPRKGQVDSVEPGGLWESWQKDCPEYIPDTSRGFPFLIQQRKGNQGIHHFPETKGKDQSRHLFKGVTLVII